MLSCLKMTSILPDGTCSVEPDFEKDVWPAMEKYGADVTTMWLVRPRVLQAVWHGLGGLETGTDSLIKTVHPSEEGIRDAMGRIKYTIRDGQHSILFSAGIQSQLLAHLVALWPTRMLCQECPLAELFEGRLIRDVLSVLDSVVGDEVAFSFGHSAEPLVLYGSNCRAFAPDLNT